MYSTAQLTGQTCASSLKYVPLHACSGDGTVPHLHKQPDRLLCTCLCWLGDHSSSFCTKSSACCGCHSQECLWCQNFVSRIQHSSMQSYCGVCVKLCSWPSQIGAPVLVIVEESSSIAAFKDWTPGGAGELMFALGWVQDGENRSLHVRNLFDKVLMACTTTYFGYGRCQRIVEQTFQTIGRFLWIAAGLQARYKASIWSLQDQCICLNVERTVRSTNFQCICRLLTVSQHSVLHVQRRPEPVSPLQCRGKTFAQNAVQTV